MVLAFLLAVLDQNIRTVFPERQIQKALQKAAGQLGIFWGNEPERHSETGSRARKKFADPYRTELTEEKSDRSKRRD